MSTTFQTASPSLQKLDPSKRVNYTFGLVLGVEEFLQSDTYFLAKHYLENRLLHGYGTACGLDVVVQTTPQLEVQVTPGWAINPKGQEIHVRQLMCVRVNDWLAANQQALQAALGSMPPVLHLCVVLCYRECKTDVVPIPGEPCRTQSDSMAPSRIADSFELMLCLDRVASPPFGSPPGSPPVSISSGLPGSGGLCEFRPPQLEDDAVKAFAKLLSQLQVSASPPFLTLPQLEQLVRNLVMTVGSPPLGSPPAGPPYAVRAQDASDFLRAAFRTWITEVRPFIAAQEGAGPCGPPPEKCVLLAELAVSLNLGWIASGVTVDDSLRPFLVPTRLLQETFFEEAAGTVVAGPPIQTVAAGFFKANGVANGPTLNLTATPGANGEFLLQLNSGYQNPNTTPGVTYIVKGTVQDTAAPAAARVVFQFVGFEATGIRVRVLDTAGKVLAATLGFMVEISQIGGGL
ncbi:MAG: hypothetical protein LAQ69_20860 [Acidobacteriia bacterium]|nr:hypothetical protein [Terriglobia bacterium]